MRVVLSRKGFDSSYGGYPSPVMPDGTLLSLPIPSRGDGIRYSDLVTEYGSTFFDIMRELRSSIRTPQGSLNLGDRTECHLDPDLVPSVIERRNGWRPTFGQINQAQSHLANQGVGTGDLFLFFGWFRQTEWEDRKLRFRKDAPDLHVIHGYLQVDRVIQPTTERQAPPWARYHPHVANTSRLEKSSNTLYIARKELSWDRRQPGGGPLKFDEKLVLTKEGETRSIWSLPEFMREVEITYHSAKSWGDDGSFSSARIGQEFVLGEDAQVEKWARSLLEPSPKK